jgi:putative endonuclease
MTVSCEMQNRMAEHNEIGKIGEKITKEFLMKHGFHIITANYRTRYGEIDIVAKKDNKIRFVEVKSVKVRDFENLESLHVKPEDNLTGDKWRKFVTSVKLYLNNRGVSSETLWQLDLACVYINTETREGKVVLMENVHKE